MDFDVPSYILGKSKGSGGTSDYSDLSNKPSINSVELSGNKTSSDLGVQSEIDSSNKLSADLVDDTNTTNKFVTASDKTTWSGKQDALVSGTNIKTINSQSILGSGDLTISGGGGLSINLVSRGQYVYLDELTPGIYLCLDDQSYISLRNREKDMGEAIWFSFGYFVVLKSYSDTSLNEPFMYYHNDEGKRAIIVKNTYSIGFGRETATTGEWTTQNFVNDKPTTYTGYDATKTQVLKNINGTLTWITEE